MTDRLSPVDRARLAEIAAVLAPGSETMPGAAEVGLTREGGPMDRVLALRPDLWGLLRDALAESSPRRKGEGMPGKGPGREEEARKLGLSGQARPYADDPHPRPLPAKGRVDARPGVAGAATIERIAAERPQAFSALLQIVLGAYTLDPAVKRRLRYHGQRALTLPRGGFGGEDLLLLMMEGPPRFRDPKAELARRAAKLAATPLTAEALP